MSIKSRRHVHLKITGAKHLPAVKNTPAIHEEFKEKEVGGKKLLSRLKFMFFYSAHKKKN